MKRYKKIGVLLGVLAAACIATFGVTKYEERKEDIKNSDEVILEVDMENVTAVSWKNAETELSFHKDGNWLYDEDEAFPVDDEKIEEIMSVFKEFGAAFIIENVEDYEQYGLDDPLCTIDFTADDTDYEVTLGNYSELDSERYVSIGDGNVYLVSVDPYSYFDAVLDDTMKNDEIPYIQQAETISFAGAEDYSIYYEEDSQNTYCADDVYFVKKDEEVLPLDTDNIKSLLSTIRYLDLKTYATYNVTDEELAEYGLDEPELMITLVYEYENDEEEAEEKTIVLNLSQNPEEKALREAEEDEEKAAEMEVTSYIRVGDSQIVYEISEASYEALSAVAYDDLRHKEVFTADLSTITKLEIKLEDETYTITSEEEEDNRVYYYEDQEVSMTSIDSAISKLSASSFTDEEPGEKLEISFTAYLDNENFPQIEVELYRYNGEYCLAVVDGQSVSLIERSLAVTLAEAVNAIVL